MSDLTRRVFLLIKPMVYINDFLFFHVKFTNDNKHLQINQNLLFERKYMKTLESLVEEVKGKKRFNAEGRRLFSEIYKNMKNRGVRRVDVKSRFGISHITLYCFLKRDDLGIGKQSEKSLIKILDWYNNKEIETNCATKERMNLTEISTEKLLKEVNSRLPGFYVVTMKVPSITL